MNQTKEKPAKPAKPSKPRNWTYIVEQWNDSMGAWNEVTSADDTALAKQWIKDNDSAQDGDKFRTIIVTSQTTVRVETVTKRTFATASYDEPNGQPTPPAKDKP